MENQKTMLVSFVLHKSLGIRSVWQLLRTGVQLWILTIIRQFFSHPHTPQNRSLENINHNAWRGRLSEGGAMSHVDLCALGQPSSTSQWNPLQKSCSLVRPEVPVTLTTDEAQCGQVRSVALKNEALSQLTAHWSRMWA